MTCDVAGSSCDGGCRAPFDRCVTDQNRERYCTKTCETDGDCPRELMSCVHDSRSATGTLVGSCQRRIERTALACGTALSPTTNGGPCGSDHSCEDPAYHCLPGSGEPFCSASCDEARGCGEAYCASLPDEGTSSCITAPCACTVPGASPHTRFIAEALALAEWDGHPLGLCDLPHPSQSLATMFGDNIAHDSMRLDLFDRLYHGPAAIPLELERIRATARATVTASNGLGDALEMAADLWGVPLAPIESPTGDDGADDELGDRFAEALLALHAPLDETAATERWAAISTAAETLPVAVRRALAGVVEAMVLAWDRRQAALTCLDGDREAQDRYFANPLGMFYDKRPTSWRGAPIDLSDPDVEHFMVSTFGYRELATAARDLANAVQRAPLDDLGDEAALRALSFTISTPIGRVVVRGTGNDHHRADDPDLDGDIALFVDLGGDDRYDVPVGANLSIDNPVAIAIDLAGNDVYAYAEAVDSIAPGRQPADADGRQRSTSPISYSEQFRQGAGRLGLGMLFDLGDGNDHYRSLRFSQGSGVLGVGVLFDEGGDDQYVAEAGSQGSGLFGMGLLFDAGGDDRYVGYSGMQGAAYAGGLGLLIDAGGNDIYEAATGDRYISADDLLVGDDPLYSHGHNQGSGFGRRGDYPIDGIENHKHSSGGLGMLIDLKGNDRYRCGSFCQGFGYWFGVGILSDVDGDDEYDGRIYHGGAAVHMGLGIFADQRGDDRYGEILPSAGLSLGFAHDFGMGLHLDGGGDDLYRGAWQSFGTGSNQALGLFLNVGGDDDYRSSHFLGFGMATGLSRPAGHARLAQRTAGIFIDTAGTDRYQRAAYFDPDPIGDGRSWQQAEMETTYDEDGTPTGQPLLPGTLHFSVGVDRP